MSTSASPQPASRPRGFHLIELLIIIGILGVLAAIVFVAVDPSKRTRQTRNARRFDEANAVLNAILKYADKNGRPPAGIDSSASTSQMIGTAGASCAADKPCREADGGATVPECLDLTTDLVAGGFLPDLPVDPLGTDLMAPKFVYDAGHTGYYVQKFSNGRIEVGSCNPESEDNGSAIMQIKVKR